MALANDSIWTTSLPLYPVSSFSCSSSHVCLLLFTLCQAACPSNMHRNQDTHTHTYTHTHALAQPIGDHQSPYCLPLNALFPGQQEGMRPTLLKRFKLGVDFFFSPENNKRSPSVKLCPVRIEGG